VMKLHKLTAGDGYSYLTRQVCGLFVPNADSVKIRRSRSVTSYSRTVIRCVVVVSGVSGFADDLLTRAAQSGI
jgi:hypothetical protein